MGTPSSSVGPGFGAFVAFFLLAVALWLLMRNMNARMRRMAYREQERVQSLLAEQERLEAGEQVGGQSGAATGAEASRAKGPPAAPDGDDVPDGRDEAGPPAAGGR